MARRIFTVLILVTAVATAGGPADDANALKQEVDALRALHALSLTKTQLREWLSLTLACADQPRRRASAEAPAAVRHVLRDLRNAYIDGDDERIADLEDKYDELFAKLEPEFDDGFEITDAARSKAPGVVRRLSLSQLVTFVNQKSAELADPRQTLEDALTDGKDLRKGEWDEVRDAAAEDIAAVIAGTDAGRAAKVKAKVANLLDRWHEQPPTPAEFDRAVQELTGGKSALDLLRNALDNHAAKLLSNPQTAAAIRAKLAGAPPGGNDA